MLAASVAGLGYPALGIGYFQGTDQPGVDGGAVLAFGVSRGEEMALWLAANRPDLVHGAIAPVDADAIVCGSEDDLGLVRLSPPRRGRPREPGAGFDRRDLRQWRKPLPLIVSVGQPHRAARVRSSSCVSPKAR